jgi:hypothetical protein
MYYPIRGYPHILLEDKIPEWELLNPFTEEIRLRSIYGST